MPRQQTPAQRETIERVMHEFKHGELKTARFTRKVRNPKQAIAIALHKAGASNDRSPAENRRSLRRTKAKEHRGRGEPTARRGMGETTKAELYQEARKRDIRGRSKMTRRQLEEALRR